MAWRRQATSYITWTNVNPDLDFNELNFAVGIWCHQTTMS